MSGTRDRLVVAAFLCSALLGGANGVAIRFSNRELAPLWGSALRFVIAALILLALMLAFRIHRPRGRALWGGLLWGLLQFAQFGFAYYALIRIQAGVGVMLLALVPLVTVLLAAALRQERLRAAALLGTVLGLAGVGVISRHLLLGDVPLPSLLAVLASVLCMGGANVLARGLPRMHPVALNSLGTLSAAVVLLAGSAIIGEPHALPQRPETWAALLYVGTIGSVAVFLLYIDVLNNWGPSRASYVLLLVPFVTVALSAWLDNEIVDSALFAGGALILVGVYVGALRRRGNAPSRREPTPAD